MQKAHKYPKNWHGVMEIITYVFRGRCRKIACRISRVMFVDSDEDCSHARPSTSSVKHLLEEVKRKKQEGRTAKDTNWKVEEKGSCCYHVPFDHDPTILTSEYINYWTKIGPKPWFHGTTMRMVQSIKAVTRM